MSEVKSRATYEDLCKLPDHVVGEILDGELFASPRPRLRHSRAGSLLGTALIDPFWNGQGGPGGWRILFEPELHFAADIVVPDLAGWRAERLPEIPDEAFLTLAPDWVCEILSPSTESLDRLRKMRIYAREATSHIWLINPTYQTLEVYRLENGRWSLIATFGANEIVRAEPFDAVALDLGRLWADAPR